MGFPCLFPEKQRKGRTGSGKYPKFFSRQKNQSQLCIPRKSRKIGVWASGAEIQASAVDTRAAVWVSSAEKFSRSFWEKLEFFLESLGGSQRQLCIKTQPLRIRAHSLAHQNRTIATASDFRVDGAKSPEIPQKEGVLGSEIAARNRKSVATFHRTLKSQCSIAFSCLGNRAISGVRDGHGNRKNRKYWQCKYLMYCIFACSEAPHLRQTITVPGLDL